MPSNDTHIKSIGYILWISGIIYLVTGGVFGLGILYDFWTLNDQVSVKNRRIVYT